MAVPKRRTSKSKKGMRRSHDGIRLQRTLIRCPDCQALTPRHTICPACGMYKGRQIIKLDKED